MVLAGPDIVPEALLYVRESEDLMDHAREVVELALDVWIKVSQTGTRLRQQ